MAAPAATADESIASDEGAASDKGTATDEGAAHETIINQRRQEQHGQEQLRPATSSGTLASSTTVIIKAHPIPRRWLRDS